MFDIKIFFISNINITMSEFYGEPELNEVLPKLNEVLPVMNSQTINQIGDVIQCPSLIYVKDQKFYQENAYKPVLITKINCHEHLLTLVSLSKQYVKIDLKSDHIQNTINISSRIYYPVNCNVIEIFKSKY